MDWSRDWINEVRFTPTGEVASVAAFLESQNPNGPIDLAFGPEGDMFLLEYDSHALYHVQYTGACKMNTTALLPSSPTKTNLGNPKAFSLIPYQGRLFLRTPSQVGEHYDGLGKRFKRIE
jgi:hypothetical protein